MNFASLEEVETHFSPLIEAADDSGRIILDRDRLVAREGVRERLQAESRRAASVAEALRQYPLATANDLQGETAEELIASAQAMDKRIRDAAAAVNPPPDPDAAGRAAYGAGNATGGGVPPANPDTPMVAAIKEFSPEFKKTSARNPRTQFDLSVKQPEMEEQVLDTIANAMVGRAVRQYDNEQQGIAPRKLD